MCCIQALTEQVETMLTKAPVYVILSNLSAVKQSKTCVGQCFHLCGIMEKIKSLSAFNLILTVKY